MGEGVGLAAGEEFSKGHFGGQRSIVRDRRTEVRGQKSEDRSQRTEVRGQKSEVRSQRSDRIKVNI
ncbi:MAG: hypothetical protein ACLFUH_11310 [Bacteroidales bacterium]